MNRTDSSVAWEHGQTRHAWSKQLAANVLALLAWAVLWVAMLAFLVVFLSPGYTLLVVPFLLYTFYRAFLQMFVIASNLRMRRVLQEYPWRQCSDAPHGLADRSDVVGRQYGWFEFPNPARPEEKLPMVFSRHWGVGWWHRRMAPRAKTELRAQIGVVWFAGDPRFTGVIAAPTSDGSKPRRLRFLDQRTGSDGDRRSFAEWGATAEEIERGRRAGVRLMRP